jgi:hypothetical protein
MVTATAARRLLAIALMASACACEQVAGITDLPNGTAVCEQACKARLRCGIDTSSTCAAECQQYARQVDCLGQLSSIDCSNVASCGIAATCPAGTGKPSGTDGCMAVLACENNCQSTEKGAKTTECLCGCIEKLSPDDQVVQELFEINSCIDTNCFDVCNSGNGLGCVMCGALNCASQVAACT